MTERRAVRFPVTREPVFAKMRDFLSSRVTFEDLDQPLGLFVPRLDYYLSYASEVSGVDYGELVRERFDGELRDYLLEALNLGHLNRRGATVDPASYILDFEGANVRFYWIPKNACTNVKTVLARREVSSGDSEVPRNRLHKSVQETFGASRTTDALTTESRRIAIVRHPFERVVSCYLDKFAKPAMTDGRFERYAAGHIKRARAMLGLEESESDSISFAQFVWYMTNTPVYSWDPHWKPQSCFFGSSVEGIELFPIERSAEIWPYLDIEHDGSRLNASFGGRYSRPADGNYFAEYMPSQLDGLELKDYGRFLSPDVERHLRPYFEQDLVLYNRAKAASNRRRRNQ